jgi:hypothetical protein
MSAQEPVNEIPDYVVLLFAKAVRSAAQSESIVSAKEVLLQVHSAYPALQFSDLMLEGALVHEASRVGVAVSFE